MAGLIGGSIRIGTHEYEFDLLPVEKGLPLRWELIGMMGEPLLQSLAGVLAGSQSIGDLDVDKVLASMSALFSRLDPGFVYKLQETFVAHTRYRGAGDWTPLSRTWQVHFAGKYHELDALTWAHLRANYLSFLDDSDVWQAIRRAGQQALSAAQSRRNSSQTGTSGASSVASASQ